MTGELTLRGRVMPVGGIKEKVLAAHRMGYKRVLLPKRNGRDVPEIPEGARKELEIILIETLDEALAAGLETNPLQGASTPLFDAQVSPAGPTTPVLARPEE